MNDLHRRVARALGWSLSDVRSLSLPSLRELVRPVDPDLAREMDLVIQSGAHVAGARAREPSPAPSKVPAFKISSIDPAGMTAGQINKELDKLDEQDSRLGHLMIEAGRGHERPSEYLRMADPLATELRRNYDRRTKLHGEIGFRYGPNAPRRLPPGRFFGPRRTE